MDYDIIEVFLQCSCEKPNTNTSGNKHSRVISTKGDNAYGCKWLAYNKLSLTVIQIL